MPKACHLPCPQPKRRVREGTVRPPRYCDREIASILRRAPRPVIRNGAELQVAFDAFDGLFLCLTPPLAGGSAGHPRPDPYLLSPGGFAQSCVLAPEGRTNPHRPHGSRSQVRVKPHTSRERFRHPCKKVPGPPSNRSPLEPIERAGMGRLLRLTFSVEVLVPLAGPATGTDQRHSANRLFLLCKTAECNRNWSSSGTK